jgi:probable HAF family extracellular repeat protein
MRKDRVSRAVLCSIVLAVTWFAVALPEAAAAESSPYMFIRADIGTRTGQLGISTLTDINDKGKVMGAFSNSEMGPHGYVLNKNLHPSYVRCSKNVVATTPQSINTRGEIAGFASVVVERIKLDEAPFEIVITKVSGFFLNSDGKCRILDFPAAELTEALGLNDNGQVVGDYRDAAGKYHGFIWEDGAFHSFDVPVEDAAGTALNQINNSGQILGIYWDNSGNQGEFVSDNGSFSILPGFPGALFTEATDINDRGQIVGKYADGDGVFHGFIFENGSFSTIDVPFPEAVHTVLSGINNRGQVVGSYLASNPDDQLNPYPSYGFIAAPNGEATLLAAAQQKKSKSR